MAAPNRAADVAAICADHPEAFPQDEGNDAARLQLLQAIIIPTLNLVDGGDWGYMTKTDQRLPDGRDKIPCDVLMWRPTNDVIDCLTGTGACWIEHDPPPPAWVWTRVSPVLVPPRPPLPPPDEGRLAVIFSPVTIRMIEGTLMTLPEGFVALATASPDGWHYVSIQPDGRVESRDAIGLWEKATRVDGTVLRYSGTGTVYHLLMQPV